MPEDTAEPSRPGPPGRAVRPADLDVPHVSPVDSYSVRLVASRSSTTAAPRSATVPALAGLVAPAPLRVNPHDLDDLGVAAGGTVRLRIGHRHGAGRPSSRTPSLPRKVVAADFNVPLGDGTVADLIDHAFPVVDLRMETP